MRLADAILLGSTSLKAKRGGRSCSADPRGCALDMALVAIGQKGGWEDVKDYWPWLREKNQSGVSRALVIASQFDCYVHNDSFSLDAFAAWVDSIDPTPRCEPPVQEPSPVETRQESTVSHG